MGIKSIRPDFARFSVNDLQNSKAEVIQLENQLVVYVDQLVGVSGHKSVIKGAAGAAKLFWSVKLLNEFQMKSQFWLSVSTPAGKQLGFYFYTNVM